MQSGYGVPELQQFMVDGCTATSASLIPFGYDMNAVAAAAPPIQLQTHHQQQQQHGHFFRPPPSQTTHTHHFFLHQQFHGLPFSQQQQRRLHPELDGQDGGGFETSGGASSPPPKIVCGQLGVAPPPRFVATNFSLAVSEAGEEAGLNAVDRSEQRSVAALPKWHHHLQQPPTEEAAEAEEEEAEAGIKEPFWKRLEMMEYMSRNGKNSKVAEAPVNQILGEEGKTSGSNYGFFSELQAIYNGGSGGSNQAGSGSALTGENTANPAGPAGNTGAGVDHGSETSAGEEVPRKKLPVRRRKSRQKELSSIAGFFEGLVKQLMDHQESLHSKFLEVMERREKERVEREEAWRRQESARISREAAARAREQALASTREAAIISYLEKISGENLKLPTKIKAYKSHTPPAMSMGNAGTVESVQQEKSNSSNLETTTVLSGGGGGRRWPKSEVQTLIKIRSGLEGKFQEPGLKAPLWDEVSESMAVLGYQRSAKRCKEKWENINKYFRKTKESAKKRPRHSKTCPYFHQLDELYSKDRPSSDQDMPPSLPSSDLLDAIVVTTSERTPLLTTFVDQLDHSFGYSDQAGSSMQLDDSSNDLAVNELNARQVLLQLQEDLGGNEDDDDEDDDQDDGNDYPDHDDDEADQ